MMRTLRAPQPRLIATLFDRIRCREGYRPLRIQSSLNMHMQDLMRFARPPTRMCGNRLETQGNQDEREITWRGSDDLRDPARTDGDFQFRQAILESSRRRLRILRHAP